MVQDFDLEACGDESIANTKSQLKENESPLLTNNLIGEAFGEFKEDDEDDPIMKLLQTNPELRQSLEQSLRKNNMLANRMKRVGVSPLRQKSDYDNNK